MDEFIGIIKLFAGNFAPQYWAFCNGQMMQISQYQALFAVIGTTYGGDGRSTFALPDLRSRVAVFGGQGPGSGGVPAIALGQFGGETVHTLISTEMPTHTHTAAVAGNVTLSVTSANASIGTPTAGSSIAAPGTLAGRTFTSSLGFDTSSPNTALNPASVTSSLTVTNATAGGNQPHNNMQPFLGLSYIICLQGLYPTRG